MNPYGNYEYLTDSIEQVSPIQGVSYDSSSISSSSILSSSSLPFSSYGEWVVMANSVHHYDKSCDPSREWDE